MEKELPQNKEQFKQGPAAKMTDDQKTELLQKQQGYLVANMPALKIQAEYEEMMFRATELAVLTGKLPANQVPGLQGLELQIREAQALEWLAQYKQGQVEAVNRAKEEQDIKNNKTSETK